MRQPPKSDPDPESRSSTTSTLSLLTDMADTTWRMFVPIVGLLLVGRDVDTRLGTKPLLMLVGATIGALIAAALIKRQLNRGSTKDTSK